MLLLAGCIGEQREQQLGDQLAQQIGTELPAVRDPLLNLYVQRLGQRIARVSDRPNLHYRFHILDSDVANAFALPGGHVYLTRGLIERTRDVSQLSGVLAHEVGHIAARHGAEQMERQLRTGSLMSFLYQTILGREPALLEQQALRIGGRLWLARHSREDELEADRLAAEYLIEAGVDPSGIVTFLDRLGAEDAARPSFRAAWFSTHPLTGERITQLEREIRAQESQVPEVLLQDVPSYPAFLRRMRALPHAPVAH